MKKQVDNLIDRLTILQQELDKVLFEDVEDVLGKYDEHNSFIAERYLAYSNFELVLNRLKSVKDSLDS